MRMLIKATIPTKPGNSGLKDGSMMEKLDSILADARPEAVYFFLENGLRTCLIVCDMEDSSQLAAAVEPWFLSMEAQVMVVPVLNGEDFEKAGPSLGAVIEKYG